MQRKTFTARGNDKEQVRKEDKVFFYSCACRQCTLIALSAWKYVSITTSFRSLFQDMFDSKAFDVFASLQPSCQSVPENASDKIKPLNELLRQAPRNDCARMVIADAKTFPRDPAAQLGDFICVD